MTALVGEPVGAVRSLEQLFRAHHPALLRLAYVLTGSASLADDLVQDAFVHLHRSRSWPAPGAEQAYLRRTVVNLSHGHHRRLAVARRHVEPPVADAPGADVAAEAAVRQHAIVAAVRRLPARQRDCVVLHYFAGLTDAEIAADLDITPGSVKTHLHRARAALAQQLEDLR